MNNQTNYRLVNIQNKEILLRKQRHEIIVSKSQKTLDMILNAKTPASLIQSFPDQDLYYLMHKIGHDDFIPVLSMATSKQWEYIIDVEVWDQDRLDAKTMTKVFDLLYQADPNRLLRWIVKEKPDFFEFFLTKNMEIRVREHDEPPPSDFDDYITIDDKFYFRFPEKPKSYNSEDIRNDQDKNKNNDDKAYVLIEKMLKAVAQMDISVFHGLLLETQYLLPVEVEEEQFRLKNLRLAEKGFLPFHEAVGIYQPTKLSSLRKRPENSLTDQEELNPDLPLPPQFFSQFFKKDNLFVRTLKLFDFKAVLVLESEIAALINKIICADKIKIKAKEDFEHAILQTCDYLNLGLEIIIKNNPKPETAKNSIQEYFLEDIFRTGSRAGIKLKTKAINWFKQSFINTNSLPLSFLGEKFLGVIGGLFLDRPLYYDNYASGKLYRNFKSIFDIKKTNHILEQVIAIDMIIGKLNIDIKTFCHGVLTYKTLILTLWAKSRLNLPANLEPIDTKIFKDFFKALFLKTDKNKNDTTHINDLIFWISQSVGIDENNLPEKLVDVLQNLMTELKEEYADVNPDKLDPRFISHFLLKNI